MWQVSYMTKTLIEFFLVPKLYQSKLQLIVNIDSPK